MPAPSPSIVVLPVMEPLFTINRHSPLLRPSGIPPPRFRRCGFRRLQCHPIQSLPAPACDAAAIIGRVPFNPAAGQLRISIVIEQAASAFQRLIVFNACRTYTANRPGQFHAARAPALCIVILDFPRRADRKRHNFQRSQPPRHRRLRHLRYFGWRRPSC